MIFILADDDDSQWAHEISASHGWPIVSQKGNKEAFYLKKAKDGLCVDYKDLKGVGFDFSKKYFKLEGSVFAKAIGKGSKKILDATAGLLKDSHKMLLLGHEVTAFEIQPLVYELSKSAISVATKSIDSFSGLNLVFGNSLEVNDTDADVIYIDPMFHHVNKSALPKKDMQLFRKINESFTVDSSTESQFIEWAKGLGIPRVVVKRPIKQPKDKLVAHSFTGKSVRYDLYTNN